MVLAILLLTLVLLHSSKLIEAHTIWASTIAQAEYNRCVDFALREMQVGEQCTWEVPGNSIGVVKLVQIDATGCHYMFNTMMYRGKQKHFQETACYNSSAKRWKFN